MYVCTTFRIQGIWSILIKQKKISNKKFQTKKIQKQNKKINKIFKKKNLKKNQNI